MGTCCGVTILGQVPQLRFALDRPPHADSKLHLPVIPLNLRVTKMPDLKTKKGRKAAMLICLSVLPDSYFVPMMEWVLNGQPFFAGPATRVLYWNRAGEP